MKHHIKRKIDGILHTVGSYALTGLPGCEVVIVSHDFSIMQQFRGMGFGKSSCQDRIQYAREHGFQHMICTVRKDNESERHILASNGWKKIDEFYNEDCSDDADSHWVEIWSCNPKLKPEVASA